MAFRKILFVCMGNSCSSPMAETIMENLMVKTSLYWEVDSAALRTWNIGRRPHKRCLRTLREHGLRSDHFCRLLSVEDFCYYNYIIAIDLHVYKELLLWAKLNRIANVAGIINLSEFRKHGKPAHITNLSLTSKLRDFRSAYYQIKECCKQFILAQHVRIIKYDLPSTEEEDNKELVDYQTTLQRSLSLDTLETVEQYSAKSIETKPKRKCNKRKLCQKCCEKFIADL
ncbi:CG14297 [Drosophila busckii]|uniref:acid phosphatase n=1 Tax=Drosophila busckii TaxID=30019 RepID=A0A0M4EPJ8_DROBS|nr:low molecular weight phosphotyrosine protein phosphatase [Drosophila busckii]ALC46060.1 CG14297 [Drosophila busckii]